MIPIPDEEHSLYTPDHIFDQISMYIIVLCLSIDVIYYIASVLFVRMWYESQPTFIRIFQTIGIHYILYWMILLDLYVYSRTVHYTNHPHINVRNSENDTALTTIVMVGILCTTIGVVVFMTYHKLRHTREHIIEGGPPLPMETFQRNYLRHPPSRPPMVIVITGANTGIGKETVRLLYQILSSHSSTSDDEHQQTVHPHWPEAKILLLCRSIEKGQEAIQDILSHATEANASSSSTDNMTHQHPSNKCQLQVIPCDLCSFRSIRKAVDQILNMTAAHQQTTIDTNNDTHHTSSSSSSSSSTMPSNDQRPKVIHTLINNAGVMMSHLTYTSDDDHETCVQANFLGHFLLSSLLLPYISTSIINVTSSTYQLNVRPLLIQSNTTSSKQNANNFSWNGDDIQCRTGRRKFSLFGQYAITKWCNMLHTIYLSKHYSHLIYSSSIHPGLVRTDVTRNMPYYLRIPNEIFAILLQTLQKTPIQGAWNTIHVLALAAQWYGTNNEKHVVTDDPSAVNNMESSSECTPLQTQQRKRSTQNKSEAVQDMPHFPNGQYWVNRQPQPIPSRRRRHFATRIDEQAEAVWDWAIQQVQLTTDEIQELQRLKVTKPSAVRADRDDSATDPLTTHTTNTIHSKVD